MNFKDNVKLSRLFERFELNYRLTHLYSEYLSYFPNSITKNIIDAVRADSDLTVEEAIIACLTELFGLSYDRVEDRALIRDYLPRSVKVLDPKRYTEDPYYKNIKIENKKIGAFELRQESYKPYRGIIADDMKIFPDMSEFATLGFFEEEFFFPAVLEDGNEWMTLTPVDLDTCQDAIKRARGKTVTFGLGLGYYAYMCSEKPEVETITVIEKSPDVIKLFNEHILPQFSHPEKVIIVNEDAFEYAEKTMPRKNFDFAFVDTWRDASDGLPMYERMKALEGLSPSTEFSYWIEGFILSRKRSLILSELKSRVEQNGSDIPESYEEILSLLLLDNL